MKPIVQTIFLDFDGTIADTLPALKQSFEKLCSTLSIPYSDSLFSEFQGPSLDQIVTSLHQRSSSDLPLAEVKKSYLKSIEGSYAQAPAHFFTKELLTFAYKKGIKVWIVSSSRRSLIEAWLHHKGLNHQVSGITSCESVEKLKPSAEPYLQAIRESGADVAWSVAVEDSLSGLKAARMSGLKLLFLGQENSASLDGGCKKIESLEGVVNWLKDYNPQGMRFRRPPVGWKMTFSEKAITWSPQIVEKVNSNWDQICKARPKLFDGPTLLVNEKTNQVILSSYKFSIALQDPEIQQSNELRDWRSLAITGIVESESGFLFGKRANVFRGAGFWELLPSGGLEKEAVTGDSIIYTEQFFKELEEETGIPRNQVIKHEACGIFVEGNHTLEIVIKAKVGQEPEVQAKQEYDEFRAVPLGELSNFTELNPILPASQFLIYQINSSSNAATT